MELITPYEIISYQGINYKTSQIVDCTDIIDIDNDENIEIITEELNTITKEKIIRTYKFNGLKYSLWKEVTEPVQ
jgi:Zn-finger protein